MIGRDTLAMLKELVCMFGGKSDKHYCQASPKWGKDQAKICQLRKLSSRQVGFSEMDRDKITNLKFLKHV